MKINLGALLALGVLGGATSLYYVGWERPPMESVQRGYRGVGMVETLNPRSLEVVTASNVVPKADDPVDQGGDKAGATYENVKVLGDVSVEEFGRLMQAMTNWVAPVQGCTYCHNAENFADDGVYTKVVARRMLQMTRQINATWSKHVGTTGVTCYTCHRGNPVPQNVWFSVPASRHPQGMLGNDGGQNMPAIGSTSLPYDPFDPFLAKPTPIRVESTTALPGADRSSIKQTEWTYSLMIHMSNALGVNCTYCHNSRQFASWEQSSPARVNAWYGIRMVRDLNIDYLVPLTSTFPDARHGQMGDVAKINCATCHQGAYKPLLGVSMVKDYPELLGPAPAPAAGQAAAVSPLVIPGPTNRAQASNAP